MQNLPVFHRYRFFRIGIKKNIVLAAAYKSAGLIHESAPESIIGVLADTAEEPADRALGRDSLKVLTEDWIFGENILVRL